MSVVLIDKGVPIPVRSNGQERTDLPLVEMEIGDSFVLPAGYNKAVTRIWRVA